MDVEVEHRPDERRFVAVVDGRESFLSYAPVADDTLDFRHTWVDPALRGRGVGDRIVRTALEYARDRGLAVIPSCWYVETVVRRRPEYRPVLR